VGLFCGHQRYRPFARISDPREDHSGRLAIAKFTGGTTRNRRRPEFGGTIKRDPARARDEKRLSFPRQRESRPKSDQGLEFAFSHAKWGRPPFP